MTDTGMFGSYRTAHRVKAVGGPNPTLSSATDARFMVSLVRSTNYAEHRYRSRDNPVVLGAKVL